jgi:hypothetical protein
MMPRNQGWDSSSIFPGTGVSKLITSWLYNKQALTDPRLKQALMGAVDNATLLYSDFTAGPGTWNPPNLRGGSNAVQPAWRSAIVRPAAEKHWAGADSAKLARSRADFLRFGQSLRRLAPHMGTYSNEADLHTPESDWAFFGSNYQRLLDIKNAVDPHGVFWCYGCVGDEAWEETPDGELCRAQASPTQG